MAILNKTRTIAAALLGTAVLGAPITSFAQDYRTSSNISNCHVNNNNQVAGGVIGAVIGGVIGSEVSNRGSRTGGTIAGATIGAIAGAAIAGSSNNCHSNVGYASPSYSNHGISSPAYYNTGTRVIITQSSFGNKNRISNRRLNKAPRNVTRRAIVRQPAIVTTRRVTTPRVVTRVASLPRVTTRTVSTNRRGSR